MARTYVPRNPAGRPARGQRPEFAAWLTEKVRTDGRPWSALERAAGLSADCIGRVLRTGKRTSEDVTRKLADFFGDDPDTVAVLAGYPNLGAAAPSPLGYRTVAEWLVGVLAARNESRFRAADAAGLSTTGIENILRADSKPDRRTLELLAAYFGVSYAELRVLRGKDPRRRAAGKRNAAKIGQERMRELITEAAKDREPRTPEQRREHARMGGLTAARVTPPETKQGIAKILRVGRAIRHLKRLGEDSDYFKQEEPRARAQIAEIRKDARPTFKKRSAFLRDLEIAEQAVRLKDAEKRSYYEVAARLFVEDPVPGTARRAPTPSEIRRAGEAVQRGRALRLGRPPQP